MLLLEDGGSFLLEDSNGLLLEDSPITSPDVVTGTVVTYDQKGIIEPGVQIHATVVGVVDIDNPPLGFLLDNTKRTEVSDANGVVTFSNLIKSVTYSFRRGVEVREFFYTIPFTASNPYELSSVIGKP